MRNRCGQVAAVLLLALGTACGNTKEEHAFDALAKSCNALATTGGTIGSMEQLANDYASNYYGAPLVECRPDWVALQQCPAASASAPYCKAVYYFIPVTPSTCQGQGGGDYCACEIRFLQSAQQAQGLEAPLCASRFLRGQ